MTHNQKYNWTRYFPTSDYPILATTTLKAEGQGALNYNNQTCIHHFQNDKYIVSHPKTFWYQASMYCTV